MIATATALTAASVVDGLSAVCVGACGAGCSAVSGGVCGGGRWGEECYLDGDAAEGLEPLGVKVRVMEELGVPAQAKEAVAFALLGLVELESFAGKYSGGYRGAEGGGFGEGYPCLRDVGMDRA